MDMNENDIKQEFNTVAQLIVSHCIGIMSNTIERDRGLASMRILMTIVSSTFSKMKQSQMVI